MAWEVPASKIRPGDVDDILRANGIRIDDAKIQTLSASGEPSGSRSAPSRADVQSAVASGRWPQGRGRPPRGQPQLGQRHVGLEITEKAIRALIVFFVVIALYITFRFEWKMAIGALAAVVHDVLISVGVYSIFGFEVTPATVIAFLTILGLLALRHDRRVRQGPREHQAPRPAGARPTATIVNLSMNQVLMRSLNTSLAAVLPVLSLSSGGGVMGAVALRTSPRPARRPITGAYSSIFVPRRSSRS